ncbi:M36 family metallopeptidase, partial [bacterium]|nr:M36 family metallopeptidase [bacterium]
ESVGEPEDLRIAKVYKSKKTSHVQFQQFYGKVKVYNSGIRINMDAANNVLLVNGNYKPDVVPTNKKKLKVSDILRIAKNAVNLKALRGKIKHESVIYPLRDEFRRSYQVRIPASKPLGDWEVIIDSESGKVHKKVNRLIFLDGSGKTYKYNPLKSKIDSVKLINMDKTKKLQGSFIKIENDDSAEAISDDRKYNFDKENVHFDEVMAFYHFNIVHDYFKKLGFKDLDKPLVAVVHYGENYDNAFYSPWSESFAFGDGNKLNSLVQEAAVVYHEYTHAVTGAILDLHGDEGGAINEGFSDYFACSITEDPKIGEWAMNKLGKPYMRYLINDWVFPDDMQGEIHADSVIWSSALWELRKIYGKKDIDLLAHKCRYFMPKWGAKFVDGYEALLACDEELFKSKHAKKIKEIFKRKGIASKENQTVHEKYWKEDQTNIHLYR